MLGLRTIDGSCNNLLPNQERFGAADEVFKRLAPADYRPADTVTFDWDGPGPLEFGDSTSYAQTTGIVEDNQTRVASNLIVDQTNANPAALAVTDDAVAPFVGPITPTNVPTPVFIENVAPDAGLSPPFNSMFVFFGQFFDHGLDLTTKSGSTVYMPLLPDDPIRLENPSAPPFMAISRATNPDFEPLNLTTPFVDQQQTYGSTPSQHVFLREYMLDPATSLPIATGKMLNGPGGVGLATWTTVKDQAADLLGIQLVDADALNIPLLATDPYGNYIPGANGYPQIVSPSAPGGLLEGDPTANAGAGVLVPGDAELTGHAFLIDIAHHSVPGAGLTADVDGTVCRSDDPCVADYHSGGSKVGTYDDEMLAAHFICGDGRCNENIGLSAVHHVFHSEHNRLVEHIKDILIADNDPLVLAEWQLAAGPPIVWNGDRLVQAARFATEMQYQHLAFEEFARRVQPAINVFDAYDATINAAISVEFSQAVYRYGHSQLPENLIRYNNTGPGVPLDRNDISLLDAFLNPPAYYDDGHGGTLTPDEAAGSLARGMATQLGQEIDEFVTETLRNELLGLLLDLPAINMTRARDFGVPRLNNARRAFFALTNSDPSLEPYNSWSHFGLNLKHQESLVNFIAAYGTHQSIIDATDNASKRAAATALLVAAEAGSGDAFEFITSTGAWASLTGGFSTTGLEDIDLWVGGLAEKQESFGGLLGSTFNYVFETQMERLQEGDRFYYLGRTGGMNLLAQLEGNSFSELIERNTDAMNLPGDVFSVPTFFFDAAVQGSIPGTPIVDDPATPGYDERLLLTREPDGTILYSGSEHVNWGGSDGADRIHSGGGIDTVRGGDGNDHLEGGGDGDVLLGGNGDDILVDIFGPDDLRGGDGNDAIHSGPGLDLIQPGRGHDFTVGGTDGNIHIGGEGNDFIFGGDAADEGHGDDGDDWLEGGDQGDNLEGDSGLVILLGVDVNTPGHDVLNGDAGDDRLFGEGGDDIMFQGPGLDRFLGQLGFDWVTHYRDPQPAQSDFNFNALVLPPPFAQVDVFTGVEALSGWNQDDDLRGDSLVALDQVGHELDAAGIARISGLSELLLGATSFTGGNIIIGGAGSDVIEGRGGNDFIDGDAWLRTQLQAPVPGGGTRLVDSMLQLESDVFARLVNPGDISIVRTIVPGTPGGDVDTAVFSGPLADYTIVDATATTPLTVIHALNNLIVDDGTDTLVNVEFLQFADQTVQVAATGPGPDITPPSWRVGFDSTDVPVAIPDLGTATSTLAVSGVGTIADVNVTLSATHTWDGDLDVFLISPASTRVELFTDVGAGGDNFTGTTLDDEAGQSIVLGVAPFTGSFRPEGSLADFDGETADGTWTLEITDDEGQDIGTLLSWSVSFDGAGAVVASNETNTTVDLAWSGATDDVGVVDYNVYQNAVRGPDRCGRHLDDGDRARSCHDLHVHDSGAGRRPERVDERAFDRSHHYGARCDRVLFLDAGRYDSGARCGRNAGRCRCVHVDRFWVCPDFGHVCRRPVGRG